MKKLLTAIAASAALQACSYGTLEIRQSQNPLLDEISPAATAILHTHYLHVEGIKQPRSNVLRLGFTVKEITYQNLINDSIKIRHVLVASDTDGNGTIDEIDYTGWNEIESSRPTAEQLDTIVRSMRVQTPYLK